MAAPTEFSLSFWMVTSSQHMEAVSEDIARDMTKYVSLTKV